MAKIHPDQALSLSPYLTSQRETFTIWMKSLVCHTNGCTVYNSAGQIVFRVDNYDKKCSNEVHLMDLQGKVLYTIRKKVIIKIYLHVNLYASVTITIFFYFYVYVYMF